MKQLKPFTKISLGLLLLGTLLSLCGYLTGAWSDMKEISQNYYQLQSVTLSDIKSIEVNERISIMPSPDEDFHLYYYRNSHKNIDLLNHQVQDGKLIISSSEQGLVTYQGLLEPLFSLANGQNVENYQPILQIPKNSHLEEVTGNITGDLYLEHVKIDTLDLTIRDGESLIEQSQIKSVQLSQTTGDMVIKESSIASPTDVTDIFGNTITIHNGNFTGESLKLAGKHSITNHSGSITLTLDTQTQKDIYIEAFQNNEQIDLPHYSNKATENYLLVHTENGSISVQ